MSHIILLLVFCWNAMVPPALREPESERTSRILDASCWALTDSTHPGTSCGNNVCPEQEECKVRSFQSGSRTYYYCACTKYDSSPDPFADAACFKFEVDDGSVVTKQCSDGSTCQVLGKKCQTDPFANPPLSGPCSCF